MVVKCFAFGCLYFFDVVDGRWCNVIAGADGVFQMVRWNKISQSSWWLCLWLDLLFGFSGDLILVLFIYLVL